MMEEQENNIVTPANSETDNLDATQSNLQSSQPTQKTVLVPIVTGKESDPEFLENLKLFSKIVLVFIVDNTRAETENADEIGARLRRAEETMDAIKKQNANELSTVTDLIEWGNPTEKIAIISQLQNAEMIAFSKSRKSEELALELQNKGLKVALY